MPKKADLCGQVFGLDFAIRNPSKSKKSIAGNDFSCKIPQISDILKALRVSGGPPND
jgi:hypothetical protein